MTPEERFNRIEELHGQQMEMAREDRAAYIAWKRDMESRVDATWRAIERTEQSVKDLAEENKKGFAALREENAKGWAELRAEFAARDAVTDKRIADLVSAVGDLCRRLDGKSELRQ
jgi:dsDNA-specific endonuclease/ATPase MutS2